MRPKNILRSLCREGLLALILIAAVTLPVRAQNDEAKTYPNRVIRIVRRLRRRRRQRHFRAIGCSKTAGYPWQAVIVENRPGAGGRLASEYVATQPPTATPCLLALPVPCRSPRPSTRTCAIIRQKLRADGDDCKLSIVPRRAGERPVKSVKELVAFAKAHPDTANYATTSPTFTITSELLKLKTGMPGVAVPYRSSSEILVSVMSEQTMFGFVDGPPAIPMINAVKSVHWPSPDQSVRTFFRKSRRCPRVGFPDVDVLIWSGVFAPANTPPAIVKKLEARLKKPSRFGRAEQAQGDGGQPGR